MKMIVASNNKSKLREFREIFEDSGLEMLSQGEAGCDFEVEETGETFEENAFLKADAVCKAAGIPAISDDSGLMVDALGGEPGVKSARYTGSHDSTDAEKCAFLLKKLEGQEHRAAKFVSSICCVFPNGDTVTARGECRGRVIHERRGENGFGYDSIFLPDGSSKTMAEMTPEEKNAVSHRGRALREFQTKLQSYLKGTGDKV